MSVGSTMLDVVVIVGAPVELLLFSIPNHVLCIVTIVSLSIFMAPSGSLSPMHGRAGQNCMRSRGPTRFALTEKVSIVQEVIQQNPDGVIVALGIVSRLNLSFSGYRFDHLRPPICRPNA